MKVLFLIRHPGHVRSLESVFRLLGERGHKVELAFQKVKTAESQQLLRRIAEDSPAITVGELAGRHSPGWSLKGEWWAWLAKELRLSADYLRYLEPRYADAEGLRARGERKAPALARRIGRSTAVAGPRGVALARSGIQLVERCLTPAPIVARFVADHDPDVLVATQMVAWSEAQTDYVRAAKQLGRRTAYVVLSWDNLTNKGLVHEVPDRVLVWNDLQVAEAVELHGIAADRLRMTGAPGYDHWFDWEPSRSREEFCGEVGIRADRPIVLYVCSSRFTAADEAPFVRRWLAALRAHGGLLREAGVVVRQHPDNPARWRRAGVEGPQVSVWPKRAEEPLDTESRQRYFDSIYHAGAVVGINTSAQIESAIVGRPVHTVLAEEFRATQVGTLHFHYLQAEDFGHLHVGGTLEEHLVLLEQSLRNPVDDRRDERFLRRFVRPFGLDVPATPLLVDALEELVEQPPAGGRTPRIAPAVRLGLEPFAAVAAHRAARRLESAGADGSPLRALRSEVKKLAQGADDMPVVAGPWLGDEIGELLYWIPFLRWAQTTTFGLRKRLWVLARRGTRHWYEGLDARVAVIDDVVPTGEQMSALLGTEGFAGLSADLVDALRPELARQGRKTRIELRLLDFAPLTPGRATDLELPEDFFAARFSFGPGFPASARNAELAAGVISTIAERAPVVVLDPPDALRARLEPGTDDEVHVLAPVDAELEAAVLARARSFFGSYGPSAYVAALLGVPAAGVHSGGARVLPDDLRLASAFLGRPPFGEVCAIDAAEGVEGIVALVENLGSERIGVHGAGV